MSVKVISGKLNIDKRNIETDVLAYEKDKGDAYVDMIEKENDDSLEDFAQSPQMPINPRFMKPKSKLETRKQTINVLQRLGFFIPDIIPAEYEDAVNDPVFILAMLPDGWSKKVSQAPYSVDIYDQLGRKRLMVILYNNQSMYEATYEIVPRFEIMTLHLTHDGEKIIDNFSDIKHEVYHDTFIIDNVNISFPVRIERYIPTVNESMEQIKDRISFNELCCHKWLRENYPEWKNPFSYWD